MLPRGVHERHRWWHAWNGIRRFSRSAAWSLRACDIPSCSVARYIYTSFFSSAGLAHIAGALSVELLAALLQHPAGPEAPAAGATGAGAATTGSHSNSDLNSNAALGAVPHMVRGQLASWQQVVMNGQAFSSCTACSAAVVDLYQQKVSGVHRMDSDRRGRLGISTSVVRSTFKDAAHCTMRLRHCTVCQPFQVEGHSCLRVFAATTVLRDDHIFEAYREMCAPQGWEFLRRAISEPAYLEDVTGLAALRAQADLLLGCSSGSSSGSDDEGAATGDAGAGDGAAAASQSGSTEDDDWTEL